MGTFYNVNVEKHMKWIERRLSKYPSSQTMLLLLLHSKNAMSMQGLFILKAPFSIFLKGLSETTINLNKVLAEI